MKHFQESSLLEFHLIKLHEVNLNPVNFLRLLCKVIFSKVIIDIDEDHVAVTYIGSIFNQTNFERLF